MTWPTLHTFVTGEPARAEYFQGLWEGANQLKTPLLSGLLNPGGGSSSWTFTTTGVWTDIDADYYRITFESQGNPLLVWAHVRYSHSAASGDMFLTVELDGSVLGNSAGMAYAKDIVNVQETVTFGTIISSAGAGQHEIAIQVQNNAVGNAEIWKDSCLGLWVAEF